MIFRLPSRGLYLSHRPPCTDTVPEFRESTVLYGIGYISPDSHPAFHLGSLWGLGLSAWVIGFGVYMYTREDSAVHISAVRGLVLACFVGV